MALRMRGLAVAVLVWVVAGCGLGISSAEAAKVSQLTQWTELGQKLLDDEQTASGVSLLRSAADKEHVPAMVALGTYYLDTPPDKGGAPTTGRRWLERAAGQGDGQAMARLGLVHLRGEGVAPDTALGLQFLQTATANGYVEAGLILGDLCREGGFVEQSHGQAAGWYRWAADQGSSMAMLRMAENHMLGWGMPRGEKTALKWID